MNNVPARARVAIMLLSNGGAHFPNKACIAGKVIPYIFTITFNIQLDYTHLKNTNYNSTSNQCPEIEVGHLWCD